MTTCTNTWRRLFSAAALLFFASTPARATGPSLPAPAKDLVAVAVVNGGRAVLLATPGLPADGRTWRFRWLDTADVPKSIRAVVLAATGTKLLLDTAGGGFVFDLAQQIAKPGTPQYVNPRDLASDGVPNGQRHRLPAQRFVVIRDGVAHVIDDVGADDATYGLRPAAYAAIAGDGTVLYGHEDRTLTICDRSAECHSLPAFTTEPILDIVARSSLLVPAGASRFEFVTEVHGAAHVVDPEHPATDGNGAPTVSRTEASLRATLAAEGLTISDTIIADLALSLDRESTENGSSTGAPAPAWRFFHVAPDEELYVPVLEFARQETAFPSRFETLSEIASASGLASATTPVLYERYLRQTVDERRKQCTIYFRTLSAPGTWMIEYWLYYPFDVGGLSSHLHDPEHFFVEVDKLGGAVVRAIGAGHGYLAGNNIFATDRAGAPPAELPLFAMVELAKHATATDMDRDGTFTPGLDENEYRERAKIWGVRDVIGVINNQLLAYDRTMSAPRQHEDVLAAASVTSRYPQAAELAPYACCRLVPVPVVEPAPEECPRPTIACAQGSVLSHPDFRNVDTILKDWVFPHAFARAIYGLGPRQRLHSVGFGYTVDLDRMPGLSRLLPMPGRVGAEVYFWHQDIEVKDRESCLDNCEKENGVGLGLRYEQFLSNLFGIFSAVRVYSPPVNDIWITFGPMIEIPLFNHGNIGFLPGLSLRPYASPRFELKASIGFWKPRNARVGLQAGKGGTR